MRNLFVRNLSEATYRRFRSLCALHALESGPMLERLIQQADRHEPDHSDPAFQPPTSPAEGSGS